MSLVTFIKLIPYFLDLFEAVQKRIAAAETDRKVTDDLKSITKAFNENDASKLDHIFSDGMSDLTK